MYCVWQVVKTPTVISNSAVPESRFYITIITRCGTALQAGRSRVPFQILSLDFFNYIIFLGGLWPWGRLNLQQHWIPGIFSRGYRWPVPRADNLTSFIRRLFWNLGASKPWNPKGLFGPVQGLFLLYLSLPLPGQEIMMVRPNGIAGSKADIVFCNACVL